MFCPNKNGSRARFLVRLPDLWRWSKPEKVLWTACKKPMQIFDNLKRQKNVVKIQLTKLYARLTNDSNVWRRCRQSNGFTGSWNFHRGKIGCDRDFSELILIYVKQDDKKNVDRSNEEIDKIMEFMDKEIGTVKDFLSSLSWTSPLEVFSQGKSGSSECNLQLKERLWCLFPSLVGL